MIEEQHVFIVDDDAEIRDSLRILLESVTDGRDADCIVLDHNLAGMSGLDLVAVLRARGVITPVVIVSGNGKPLLARAVKEGVHAVLRKPLAADALLSWLEQVFSGGAGE